MDFQSVKAGDPMTHYYLQRDGRADNRTVWVHSVGPSWIHVRRGAGTDAFRRTNGMSKNGRQWLVPLEHCPDGCADCK